MKSIAVLAARYEVLLEFIKEQQRLAVSRPDYAGRLGLARFNLAGPNAAEVLSSIKAQTRESAILALVAAFEARVFALLDNALGEARKQLRENYRLEPFRSVAEGLVRKEGEFRGLKELQNLLDARLKQHKGALDPRLPLNEELRRVREHRNWLAHGKRQGHGMNDHRLEPGDVERIVEAVLRVIQGNPA